MIENYFTMSAEMCDCFDNRRTGVKYILNQIKKIKHDSYIFSKNGLSKLHSKYEVYPDEVRILQLVCFRAIRIKIYR